MGWALASVGLAAVSAGAAQVLQARAARRGSTTERLHPSIVWRLARDRTYLVSLLLVAVGFTLAFAALRVLPVFVVQACRASSLAVAALLATRMLGSRMGARTWGGVALTVAGLALLASSTAAVSVRVAAAAPLVLVGCTVAIAAGGVWTAALPASRARGLRLAVLSGLGFAVLAAGVHALPGLRPVVLLGSPIAWAAAVGGGLGLLCTALAFQRAPAVAVSATVTGTETIGGSALGMLLAGDHAAAGRGVLAAAGVTLVLVGAAVVSRSSSIDEATSSVVVA
jgi:drug/metabolite transporter (DMT)-like permease